jgi:hypothetical protein
MSSQILGSLLTIAGIFVLLAAVSKGGKDEALYWLMSAVVIVGGLLLGALGRIESALRAHSDRELRRSWFAGVLLWLPLIIVLLLALAWFFWASPARSPNESIPRVVPVQKDVDMDQNVKPAR